MNPCSKCNSIEVSAHYVWAGSRHHLAQRCTSCGHIDTATEPLAAAPVSEYEDAPAEAAQDATTDASEEEATAEEPETTTSRVRTRRNG